MVRNPSSTTSPGAREPDPVAVAREVLLREAETLTRLAGGLGSTFRDAVELLEAVEGRVVVTGVGKSGLVGSKVAATLTSIGTPATFLHPTDAVHGDLGIVGPRDAVLALSKSGRSAELLALLPHLERRGTPVLSIVEDAASPLARASRVVIALGAIQEACSLDLVPTSSTTATMAVGDALAVALLRRRGLTPEDFAFVHPGGLIGRQASRCVGDLMHHGDRMPVLAGSATLREALVEIVDKGLGITVLLEEDGSLAGVLTDGDLKRILLGPEGDGALGEPVSRFLSPRPRTVSPDTRVASAVRIMERRDPGAVTSLVVMDGERPVGVLHLHDCLGDGRRGL